MYILYDNLTATLLAATILLILLAMQTSLAKSSVEHTANYMAKKYSLEFADWLQDDFPKIGKNMEPGDRTFENPETEDGNTVQFVYYSEEEQRDGSGGTQTTRTATVYTLGRPSDTSPSSYGNPAETRNIDGTTIELYQAIQWKCESPPLSSAPNWSWGDCGTGWERKGESAALLRHFEIEMRDQNGNRVDDPGDVNVSNPDSVQQTHVQFTLVPPFENNQGTIEGMHWGASLLLRK